MPHKRLSKQEKRLLNRFNNDIFNFFLNSYRNKIIDFCGSPPVKIQFDCFGKNAKLCFINFNNGEYDLEKPIITSQPNILHAVIIGKKGWGLWLQQWTDGIADGSFTINEILSIFKNKNISIPESLLDDFYKTLYNKRLKFLNLC